MNKFNIIIPKYNDPRWILFLFFSIYLIISSLTPTFGRNVSQMIAAVATALLLDAAFTYYKKKILFFSLSGLIASIGLCFLLYSPAVWPFAVAALLTIGSKHLIKFRGNHIFNPNNFGLVLSLLLMSDIVSTTSGRWINEPELPILFIVLGTIITYKINRLDVALSFILFFIIFTFIRYQISDTANYMLFYLPMTGPTFYLFSFFHITDPITSPATRKSRFIFAFLIGLVDAILRYNEILYAPFYALFIVTIIKQVFPILLPVQSSKNVWVYK
ncbi:MAG: hypothetical protein HN576_03230 [Bacteriovoracaceae bacterium]|jgi:enediyne biosynthesis protein E5|nr:hypothetical protein [Bacteriovoracaceae bacterium]